MSRRVETCTTRFSDHAVRLAYFALCVGAILGIVTLRLAGAQEATTGNAGGLVVQWVERTPVVKSPSERPLGSEDGSLIFDPVRDRAILYGGKDDANLGMKETWAFDPGERKWEKLVTQGRTPPASEDHTTIYDPNGHRMILFGGENGPTTNKLWSLDLKTSTWKELPNSGAPRRESHSAVYDSRGKRMVVFGGLDRTIDDIFEVWALDLDPASPTFEKWQNLSVSESRPPGRIDHAAIYDPVKNRMVFHGGWTKTRRGLFGDTWAFYFGGSLGTGRWERIGTGTTAPSARRHAVPVHDPDRHLFILLGGQGQSGPLKDVWIFDLTRDVWMNATPSGPGPVARIDHQAVYNPRTQSVILYGGDSQDTRVDDPPKLRDIWELVLPPITPLSSSRGDQ